jgi:hypothetical protein
MVKFVHDITRHRKLSNCGSNRVRSVSMVIMQGIELRLYWETFPNSGVGWEGGKVEGISIG